MYKQINQQIIKIKNYRKITILKCLCDVADRETEVVRVHATKNPTITTTAHVIPSAFGWWLQTNNISSTI